MKRLGVYYKETILSLPQDQRKEVMINRFSENLTIVNDIFGWIVKIRDEKIQCESEQEAELVVLLFKSGLMDFWLPRDQEYTKSILPEMQRIKRRTDEIIEEHIESIFSHKIRKKVRNSVYNELMNID